MPKIDVAGIAPLTGGDYPPPYRIAVPGSAIRRLSDPAGVTDLVVNHVTLPPGAWSSQRHWHEGEDEVLVMVSGTATLRDDGGATPVRAGDVLAFPKGDGNGHHLIAGEAGCVFVVMGMPERTPAHYPDIDLRWDAVAQRHTRRDGSPLD